MKTVKKTTKNKKDLQKANNQFKGLLEEAKKVNQDIDKTNRQLRERIDDIGLKIDKSISAIKQFCADLDHIEKETGDKLDTLMSEQTEGLSSE